MGILMERSADYVVSALAVAKTGAAYVPIDPAYPGERIRYMVDDTRMIVLLTQARLAAHVPDGRAVFEDVGGGSSAGAGAGAGAGVGAGAGGTVTGSLPRSMGHRRVGSGGASGIVGSMAAFSVDERDRAAAVAASPDAPTTESSEDSDGSSRRQPKAVKYIEVDRDWDLVVRGAGDNGRTNLPSGLCTEESVM